MQTQFSICKIVALFTINFAYYKRATYELSLFIYGMKGIKNIFTFDMRLSIALKFTGLLVLQCSRASFQPPQS